MAPALAGLAIVLPALAAPGPALRAQTDARGFIDVFALRRDLARAGTLRPDTQRCHAAGNAEARLSPSERTRLIQAAQDCEQAFVDDSGRCAQLNHAWLPALIQAMRQGDAVAEVILRQCSTTELLDRSGVESTCDEAPGRRAVAARRLREIGFAPAFDHDGEAALEAHGRPSLAQAQARALERFAQADFGIDRVGTRHGGNSAGDPASLDALRQSMLIDAVLSEARRAFTYSPGPDWQTSAFATLRLDRRPLTPGHMSWGRALFHGGSSAVYSGLHEWLAGGTEVFVAYERQRRALMGGAADAAFMRRLHDTLAAAEARIDETLQRDPRWAVFLLHRVGHHEWVPQGMVSDSGRLDAAWHGTWTLVRAFGGETPTATLPTAMLPTAALPSVRAVLTAAGPTTRLRLAPDPAGGGAATVACELRYSGGLSFPWGRRGDAATSPVGAAAPSLAFEPMQAARRYRQVLVQCPQGEWPSSTTARMLFLADDTMVEVMAATGANTTVVRHWRRSGPAAADRGAATLPADDPLGRLARLAGTAEAADQALRTATTTELIDRLRFSRNERLYYSRSGFPQGLQMLEQRDGIARELAAAYRAQPADPMVRFNLAMLLAHRLQDRRGGADELAAAADGLVEALRDAHPWVRTEAVWGLGFAARPGDEAAVRALLQDPDDKVRREADSTRAAIGRAAARP